MFDVEDSPLSAAVCTHAQSQVKNVELGSLDKFTIYFLRIAKALEGCWPPIVSPPTSGSVVLCDVCASEALLCFFYLFLSHADFWRYHGGVSHKNPTTPAWIMKSN